MTLGLDIQSELYLLYN